MGSPRRAQNPSQGCGLPLALPKAMPGALMTVSYLGPPQQALQTGRLRTAGGDRLLDARRLAPRRQPAQGLPRCPEGESTAHPSFRALRP